MLFHSKDTNLAKVVTRTERKMQQTYHHQSIRTGHQYKPRLVRSFEDLNVKQICACGFHSACVTGLAFKVV